MVLEWPERSPWAVVVGAGGLAEAIIEKLIRMKFKVVVCCRRPEKVQTWMGRRIVEATNQPNATIRYVETDLGVLASIRKAVSDVQGMNIMLKLLVNAAGVFAPEEHLKSQDCVDLAFAVNFVGPVLLMQLLHPLLRKNAPSTVVNVTCEDYALCNGLDLLYVARMEKDASKAGRLRVLVEYCRDLPSSHGVGSTNSYIKVLMAGQEQRTATKKFTVNPVFNERMNFLLSDHDESHVHNTTMTLEVYLPGTNKDATDQLIGKAHVPLSCLMPAADGSMDSSFSGVVPFVLERQGQGANGSSYMAKKINQLQQAILTNNFQGEFEGLDIISSGVSLDKSMDREKTIKDLFKDHTGSLFVEPDEANNRVIFHVMKKLNWFKTSKRHIVIDLEKKVLRNETIHGRMRKQFPFEQIWMIQDDFKNDCKTIIKFVKKDLYGISAREDQLSGIAAQYRREYIAALYRSTRCARFLNCLKTLKKLNLVRTGMRELVLDINERKLYNIDPGQTKKEAEQALSKDGTVLKDFYFRSISYVQDVPGNLNSIKIIFIGGQRPYEVEFMTTKQKTTFCRIIKLFLYQKPLEAKVKIKIEYTVAQSSKNPYRHQVGVRTTVPTRPADQKWHRSGEVDNKKASWIGQTHIIIPPAPAWFDVRWDRSRGMMSSNLQGAKVKDMTSVDATRHARMCMVAYTLEAARRSAALHPDDGVQFHLLDPGLLCTDHYRYALGLGRARMWYVWKARHLGTDPKTAANAIEFIIRNRVFQDINGLYVKFSKGRPVIMNLSKDGSEKIPPKNAQSLDPSWLQLHGLVHPNTKLRAQHPSAAAYDMVKVKRLWDAHVNISGYDPEDPVHTFLLNSDL